MVSQRIEQVVHDVGDTLPRKGTDEPIANHLLHADIAVENQTDQTEQAHDQRQERQQQIVGDHARQWRRPVVADLLAKTAEAFPESRKSIACVAVTHFASID